MGPACRAPVPRSRRFRASCALRVHGLFACLAKGLFMLWPKPCHKTTADFADAMAADHARHVRRIVTACQSKLAAAT